MQIDDKVQRSMVVEFDDRGSHRVSTPDVRTTRNPYSNAGLRGYQNVLFWGVGAGPCSGTVSWTVMESGIVGGTERRYR